MVKQAVALGRNVWIGLKQMLQAPASP
jgi:hypothetical protein